MITSTRNSQVKYIEQLQGRTKFRREHKEFVAEGHKMVSEAPKDRLVKVYASDTFVKSNPEYMEKLDFPYETVSDMVFAQMSDTKTPQGILAVIKMLEYGIEDMFGTGTDGSYSDNSPSGMERAWNTDGDGKAAIPLIVILENIQDPGNLGTIIRTAECAGVTGVIMSSDTVDIYNPKVIRSTMGSLYRVPFMYVQDLGNTLKSLQSKGVALNAAHLDGSTEYTKTDYRGPAAFLIGNEGNGLTDKTAALADIRVRIPMSGQAESLNAAVAAAILLYEAKRQRKDGFW